MEKDIDFDYNNMTKEEILQEIDKVHLISLLKNLKNSKEHKDIQKYLQIASKTLKDNSFIIMPKQEDNKQEYIEYLEECSLPFLKNKEKLELK